MEPVDFQQVVRFISFFAQHQTLICLGINGELQQVYRLFNSSCKGQDRSFGDFDSFKEFWDKFQDISGGSIEVCDDKITSTDWIKMDIIYHTLTGGELVPRSRDVTCNPKSLDDLLTQQESYFTDCEGFSYSKLATMLEYVPAITRLAKVRSKQALIKMEFNEVCKDKNHAKVLSKVCLSRKDMNNANARQIFPSLEQCHKAIEGCSKLFSEEIYQCTKHKIHYLPIVNNHTDISSGDCSYLDTCHKMKTCKYLHYFSLTPINGAVNKAKELRMAATRLYDQEFTLGYSNCEFTKLILPAQWINCDVRKLPFEILGKFAAIISDPAWDIHMSLPYGTCSDSELMELPIDQLQDEGIMMLWVTGRSIEIGRKALKKWGYTVSDEVIWIKMNQLNRTIVTGRTGHWLNHSKEHLLVGVKGNPIWLNKQIDINTIVSNTRQTSRKPDEIYDLVERLVGVHSRKLEIFGRDHNIRDGWISMYTMTSKHINTNCLAIGNQLKGTSIVETEVLRKYNKVYK